MFTLSFRFAKIYDKNALMRAVLKNCKDSSGTDIVDTFRQYLQETISNKGAEKKAKGHQYYQCPKCFIKSY